MICSFEKNKMPSEMRCCDNEVARARTNSDINGYTYILKVVSVMLVLGTSSKR